MWMNFQRQPNCPLLLCLRFGTVEEEVAEEEECWTNLLVCCGQCNVFQLIINLKLNKKGATDCSLFLLVEATHCERALDFLFVWEYWNKAATNLE